MHEANGKGSGCYRPDGSRRRFLQKATAGTVAAPFIARATVWRLSRAEAQEVRVRRNVYDLASNGPEIAALRNGVKVMQARSASNPRGWRFQANIHATTDQLPTTNKTLAQATWNTCQHGSFFFFPWHRMYVYFFEQILRAAAQEPSLTLPYWNYSNAAQRALPLPFRSPANSTNPLYVAQRRTSNPNINGGQPLSATVTSTTAGFARTNFASAPGSGLSFGGQSVGGPSHITTPHSVMEQTPHDAVHVAVGGSSGWMRSVNLAARDPIFWLHHCNVDRWWNQWLALGGGRANPTASLWRNQTFSFIGAGGQLITMSASQVLDTAAQLNYLYDDEVPASSLMQVASSGDRADATSTASASDSTGELVATTDGAQLGTTPRTLWLTLPGGEALVPRADRAAGAMPRGRVLRLSGIDYDEGSGIYYEIYVNLPDATKPVYPSPYYAGLLAPFAMKHGNHGAGVADYDLTAILAQQLEQGLWDGRRISLTFVPQGVEDEDLKREALPPGQAIRIGRAELRRN